MKAAASYEYDRIRKMRHMCVQMADAVVAQGVAYVQTGPKLHLKCGEVDEFAGHLATAQKFIDLDVGSSVAALLGVEGKLAEKKAKNAPKVKPEPQII